MKTTIQFTQQLINDMYAANYFGGDAYAQDMQSLWTRHMSRLGFEIGGSYDSDRFDDGCKLANALAIRNWEDTKILRNAWTGELLEPARTDYQLAERYISYDMKHASIEGGVITIVPHQGKPRTEEFPSLSDALREINTRLSKDDRYIVETFKTLRDQITENAGQWDADYIAEREAELKELCNA